MKTIKIKYFSEEIERLAYIAGKSDWIDLRAAKETVLKKGEFALIPLGVAMELPKGYEAHVIPRSSTYKNYGIIQANSCGLIAMQDTVIHVNDRICQFRIMEHQPELLFEETEVLTAEDRGGFGSTGRQ